ncbi:UBC-like protein [Artomyces pyxidatus]|uniref:UBC-like protein n=1 Tax=Artomyces pyxidatus TaxID=48021 RepID=A0ACB8T2F8_9AGAM|nr:UBC-like protein [Artomyces pyxidatus]
MASHSLNKNNSAVKRIMQEARELAEDPSTEYSAAPLEDNIFEWHCTLRGPEDTEYAGGLYHFRILLPAEYPFRPPSIMVLTPNGRFELNTKICISFTNYHEELWQPAWGVRTAIIGLQGFFPLKGEAAMGVGALEVPANERKRLAALSREWTCPRCNRKNVECLPDPSPQAEASGEPRSDGELTLATEAAEKPATDSHPPEPARADHDAPGPDREFGHASGGNAPSDVPAANPPAAAAAVAVATETIQRHVVANTGTAYHTSGSVRPPVLLDTAICVLLVLVFALICKRVF